jgi:hypothetical protein
LLFFIQLVGLLRLLGLTTPPREVDAAPAPLPPPLPLAMTAVRLVATDLRPGGGPSGGGDACDAI